MLISLMSRFVHHLSKKSIIKWIFSTNDLKLCDLKWTFMCYISNVDQYSVCILCQPGPELHIADWLSHHYYERNKDQEISGMNISIHTINTIVDIPIFTSIEDIKVATGDDVELQMLKRYIIRGWPHTKEGVDRLEKYWSTRHELAMINSIAMKGKQIIEPYLLQRQIIEQLHSNHMGN